MELPLKGQQQQSNSQLEMKFKMDPNTPPFVPSLPTPLKMPEDQNNAESKETLKQLMTLQAKQMDRSSMLIKQQNIGHLPAKELPVFTGAAFDCLVFVIAFDSIISTNVLSNRDTLYIFFYLCKCPVEQRQMERLQVH